MDSLEIEKNLEALGKELQTRGIGPVRLLMVGGAFMLTQIHNRTVTDDIDVLLKDVDDDQSALYRNFRAAVKAVALQENIRDIWMNDMIADFLKDVGDVPEGNLWKVFTELEIYIPPADYMLAHKLLAGREKDEDDSVALLRLLGITTKKQAYQLVDQYVENKMFQEISDLDGTINRVFNRLMEG